MGFSGVVKTTTHGFLMKRPSEMEMPARGAYSTLMSKTGLESQQIMALVWVNRNRRCFVSTTSSTNTGNPYERIRLRQIAEGPLYIRATVDQPKVVENITIRVPQSTRITDAVKLIST